MHWISHKRDDREPCHSKQEAVARDCRCRNPAAVLPACISRRPPASECGAYHEDMTRRCGEDTERIDVTVGVSQSAASLIRRDAPVGVAARGGGRRLPGWATLGQGWRAYRQGFRLSRGRKNRLESFGDSRQFSVNSDRRFPARTQTPEGSQRHADATMFVMHSERHIDLAMFCRWRVSLL